MAKRISKAKHYQLRWNIFKAVDVVEQYEQKTGDTSGHIPYAWLRNIYTGNLLDALQFGKIDNNQRYGVTFFADVEKPNGERGTVEIGYRIDDKMKLSELINGHPEVKVNKGGFTVKGWRGAKDEWLAEMDRDFKDCTCHNAWAVANCLVK